MKAALRINLVLALILWLTSADSVGQSPSRIDLWARWEKHDAASTETIDHTRWQAFLQKFVVTAHPSGINRIRYQAVSADAFASLHGYLSSMQTVTISNYNRAEQKAFWINVYNALTVQLVLSRYPIASIRDINISPGLATRGPWGAKLFIVEGERLTLDDIQHRILRPIWKDSRAHYALTTAALGSPHLQSIAYTARNSEALLEKSAREFINHPRGVSIQNGRLQVSTLYVWFQEDFGGGAEGLMEHWQDYADASLADALAKYNGGLAHDYDWRLNGSESKP